MISAHRCGARELGLADNSRRALHYSANNPEIEFIEFDLQASSDRQLLLSHDPVITAGQQHYRCADHPLEQLLSSDEQLVSYRQALTILANNDCAAHLDLKFPPPGSGSNWSPEVFAAQQAIEYLPVEKIVITTKEPDSLALLSSWARQQQINLNLGLSLGSEASSLPWRQKIAVRHQELFPQRVLRRSTAQWLVAERRLARWRLARWGRKRGYRLLVWTVDDRQELRYWLGGSKHRPLIITSNYPQRAVALRRQLLDDDR
jgi:glycerophosphoryl diester phosphodiesterase